jgi:hypothetical protein
MGKQVDGHMGLKSKYMSEKEVARMDSFDVNVVFKLKDCTFDKPKNDKQ